MNTIDPEGERPNGCLLNAWGITMPTHHVNLDALIVREDLEVNSSNPDRPGGDVPPISLIELQRGRSMFDVLRKPDFQRETSEWSPQQIVELVKNILDEELIPAVIVWKAPNRDVFVIDGAHRLSALIAWVNDDYGNGVISQKFYGGADAIPQAQHTSAKATRDLIDSQVGSFSKLEQFRTVGGGTPEEMRRAKSLATAYVVVQSVRNDASHAEASFYRINQGGATIDEVEREIIHSRRRPQALAARALLRAGTGHKYWWPFPDDKKAEIERLANSLHSTLYRPDLSDKFRTLDMPMAGGGYSADALSVLFDFIHIANELHRSDPKTAKAKKPKTDPLPKSDPLRDIDGSDTIKFLKKAKDIAELITSGDDGSLGLHPAVYCYSATGKFQPTAFFAQVKFVQYLVKHAAKNKFSFARCQFEEFLVEHKYFVNQLSKNLGGTTRAMTRLFELYVLVFEQIQAGTDNPTIRKIVLETTPFSQFLKEISKPGEKISGQEFGRQTKDAIKLKAELTNAPRCGICHARYHPNSTSIDHRDDKKQGGLGSMDNGSVTHPYCNTGFKNWCQHNGKPLPPSPF
ncbi:MAG TPA: DUF262 domain-containing protein [Verrucomicrobiales bacterium]|nr:DUF262 domain-containing protein [Verrucomicrobiales bacterium]